MNKKPDTNNSGAKCKEFTTLSGLPLKDIYWPEDLPEGQDPRQDLGRPGEPPYVRGAYPGMYRSQPWRIFMLTGAGSIDQASDRVAYALSQGESGFIAETDMSTWLMLDVDHPEVVARKADVGWYGAPVMSLDDYREYWGKLPIGELYCHLGAVLPQMTPFFMSCFLSLLEERNIPAAKINSTGQGDFFITYISILNPLLIPPQAGLRLNCDGIEHAVRHAPRLTPISIAGNNIRECGATSWQEMAAILACAASYIEEILDRGNLKIDEFAYTIGGVNLSTGSDFFEDICKFRAMRKMWCKLLKEYGAKEPRSLRLRVHGLPLGSIYTYQQPLNNIVRGTYTVMAAMLGGAQSIGTPSFDEAICTPTKLAHTTALRTQQILMEESNIPSVADPLGGSYFIESLTAEIESKAGDYFEQIQNRGGFIKALDSGWLQNDVARAGAENTKKIDRGERKVVGVNCYQMEESPYEFEPFRPDPNTWDLAMASLEKTRSKRNAVRVEKARGNLLKALEENQNTMPATIEAVKAGMTVGEVGEMYRNFFSCWSVPTLSGLG
ncbi:MAG: acyl-CoA mutase large subunit family protein [Deltaproteobacteria bacterium]|nr:acyl-CoA mutase large subunit family protein [Deltaproteobacteria bacterium]